MRSRSGPGDFAAQNAVAEEIVANDARQTSGEEGRKIKAQRERLPVGGGSGGLTEDRRRSLDQNGIAPTNLNRAFALHEAGDEARVVIERKLRCIVRQGNIAAVEIRPPLEGAESSEDREAAREMSGHCALGEQGCGE